MKARGRRDEEVKERESKVGGEARRERREEGERRRNEEVTGGKRGEEARDKARAKDKGKR